MHTTQKRSNGDQTCNAISPIPISGIAITSNGNIRNICCIVKHFQIRKKITLSQKNTTFSRDYMIA